MGVLPPLTARSVLLSILLGSHPPRLAVRTLVRMGALFGISDGTVRVALSRMASDGEVDAAGGWYELSEPLLARQRRLDQGRRPRLRAWRGAWQVAVLADGVNAATRAEVAASLKALNMGALRDGVWMRPDNLAAADPVDLDPRCRWLLAREVEDPAGLAGQLWDLSGWNERATALLGGLAAAEGPARRFTVAAAVARHLRDDPLLPRPLLPPGWAGHTLRRAYADYEVELTELLRTHRAERPDRPVRARPGS